MNMRKVRKGDYVKIKSSKDIDTLYLVRDVGDFSVYLDWQNRRLDQTFLKVGLDDVLVIYEAGVDPY